jgi:hypothetical protein
VRRASTKSKAPYFDTTVSVDVDVELSPAQLNEAGWHHESECAGTQPEIRPPLVIGAMGYRDAVASLHRQAHPGQLTDPASCREEPCRSLSFAQVAQRLGRPS